MNQIEIGGDGIRYQVLPIEERLRSVDPLWDSVVSEAATLELMSTQYAELDRAWMLTSSIKLRVVLRTKPWDPSADDWISGTAFRRDRVPGYLPVFALICAPLRTE